MPNDQSLWTTIKENLTPILAICGVVATLGNLWIVGTVAPLAQQITEVRAQVGTIENSLDIRSTSRDKQLDDLDARLDRIEDKLDQIIQSRIGGN